MQKQKDHLLKWLRDRRQRSNRILLLGPLKVNASQLRKAILTFAPTHILIIDGGMIHKKHLSKIDTAKILSVGDGDSSPAITDILLPQKKDVSDLEFTVSALIESKIKWTGGLAFGFSGKNDLRPDHLLFNLKVFSDFSKKAKTPLFLDETFLFFPSGKHNFAHHGTWSLITLQKTKVRITGKAQYRLDQWTVINPLSSHGLSNAGSGKIGIESKNAVIVYLNLSDRR